MKIRNTCLIYNFLSLYILWALTIKPYKLTASLHIDQLLQPAKFLIFGLVQLYGLKRSNLDITDI